MKSVSILLNAYFKPSHSHINELITFTDEIKSMRLILLYNSYITLRTKTTKIIVMNKLNGEFTIKIGRYPFLLLLLFLVSF